MEKNNNGFLLTFAATIRKRLHSPDLTGVNPT